MLFRSSPFKTITPTTNKDAVTDRYSPLVVAVSLRPAAAADPAVADTLVAVAAVATDHPPGLVVAADIPVAGGTVVGADNTPLVDVDLGMAVLAVPLPADLAVAIVPADHRIVVAVAAAAAGPIAIGGEGVVVVVSPGPSGGMGRYL